MVAFPPLPDGLRRCARRAGIMRRFCSHPAARTAADPAALRRGGREARAGWESNLEPGRGPRRHQPRRGPGELSIIPVTKRKRCFPPGHLRCARVP